jgi:hypothetical protein
MVHDIRRYQAAIEFKGAGASTKLVNLLASLGIYSIAELRAPPWRDVPHVTGLERRLLASRGCGRLMVAQIKAIRDFEHVRGGLPCVRPAQPGRSHRGARAGGAGRPAPCSSPGMLRSA